MKPCPRDHCRGSLHYDIVDHEMRCTLCNRAPMERQLRAVILTARGKRGPRLGRQVRAVRSA